MKLLYIGAYRDDSALGEVSRNFILALSTQFDLVIRPIFLSGRRYDIGKQFLDLENASMIGPKKVIQHVPPLMYDYNGRFEQNIGLYTFNYGEYIRTKAANPLNMYFQNMDLVINNMNPALNDGMRVEEIAIPTNPSKYETSYDKLLLPEIEGKFIFYYIGKLSKRKNWMALIRAFHTEFRPEEPVALVIKTDGNVEDVRQHIKMVTDSLGLYRNQDAYKKEIIITERLTEEGICSLHNTCDCFVMPSYTEAICPQLIDAAGFSKQIIANSGAILGLDYDSDIMACDSRESPPFAANMADANNFNSRHFWLDIDILSLQDKMRSAYTQRNDKLIDRALKRVYKNSYQNVGKILKEIIA